MLTFLCIMLSYFGCLFISWITMDAQNNSEWMRKAQNIYDKDFMAISGISATSFNIFSNLERSNSERIAKNVHRYIYHLFWPFACNIWQWLICNEWIIVRLNFVMAKQLHYTNFYRNIYSLRIVVTNLFSSER